MSELTSVKIRSSVFTILFPLIWLIWPPTAFSTPLNDCFVNHLEAVSEPSEAQLEAWLSTQASEDYPKTATVTASRSTETLHGQELNEITRHGVMWESSYESVPNALEGDPRNFIIALGHQVAKHFGFRMQSGVKMTAPTAEALNTALNELNRRLLASGKKPFSGLHYFTPSRHLVSDRDFVVEFLNSRIPIAREGPLFVHDISAHSMSFLIPEESVQLAQAQVRAFLGFEKFLAAHSRSLSENKEVTKFFEAQYQDAALRIDNGTGNFGIMLGRHSPHGATSSVQYLTHKGASPSVLLRTSLDNFFDKTSLSLEEKKEFWGAYRQFIDQEKDRMDNVRANPSFDKLETEIKERIKAVQSVF